MRRHHIIFIMSTLQQGRTERIYCSSPPASVLMYFKNTLLWLIFRLTWFSHSYSSSLIEKFCIYESQVLCPAHHQLVQGWLLEDRWAPRWWDGCCWHSQWLSNVQQYPLRCYNAFTPRWLTNRTWQPAHWQHLQIRQRFGLLIRHLRGFKHKKNTFF